MPCLICTGFADDDVCNKCYDVYCLGNTDDVVTYDDLIDCHNAALCAALENS